MAVLTLSDNTDNFLMGDITLEAIPERPDITAKLTACQRLMDEVKVHLANLDIKMVSARAAVKEAEREVNRALGDREYQSWLVELEMQAWNRSKPLQLEYQPEPLLDEPILRICVIAP